MAECAASLSCTKLHYWRPCVENRCHAVQNSRLRTAPRKYLYRYEGVKLLSQKRWNVSAPSTLNLTIWPNVRETSCHCWGSLVEPDAVAISDWVPIGDQVLLMTSIFLTYVAGVIPLKNSNATFHNKISNDEVEPESSTSYGRYGDQNKMDPENLKYAWSVVRGKLLDSLDAIERGNNLENKVLELEQQRPKRPLSLYAVSEGPKLRLLWAAFWQLEEKVNSIINNSDIVNVDDWLTVFFEIIRKSCQPLCAAWLEKEICLANNNPNLALVSLMNEKLIGDDTVLTNIRNSGKENLYAELLYFLCFGSLRKDCCYERNLFMLHGDSILEDLVINLADGVASIYLELVSVDGNLSNETNSLGLCICSLSTRALQKLRNEVALNQWFYQNVESVVSMFEDRFDLCILERQLIGEPTMAEMQNHSWWKRLTQIQSRTTSSPLCYAFISYFSMPVKRTKELRGLTGWRYYYSLFLELSDISMPFIRAVFNKVSNAISFFLVSLIGGSLGLIYTGIRQSLRWK